MARLQTVEEARALIQSGAPLLLAGEESVLRSLPTGNWIGGTIPYFMTADGGVVDRERVFVTRFPDYVTPTLISSYAVQDLPKIPQDYPEHGCSWIILPAGSELLQAFGRESVTYEGIFNVPLVGWVSGIHLSEMGKQSPKVVDGSTGLVYDNRAVVLHTKLPGNKVARVELLNLFKKGDGPAITFQEGGFQVKDCRIGGQVRNLAEYITSEKLDTKLPLVANYSGANINVSIQSVDAAKGLVNLYAAVFPGNDYHFAAQIGDYPAAFEQEMGARNENPSFSCNCILNFLYAGLEGRKTGTITGPITFGEVAYILLNQTMVYTVFEDLA